MAVHFHKLPVKNVRRETPQCVSVSFEIPLSLREIFSFRAGQNITVRFPSGNAWIRRSYSICSSPADGELRIAVKHLPGGIFSTYANTLLKAGTVLEVLAPTGSFTTALDPASAKKYFFFAAGSGITPVISLIKTILWEEPASEVNLFYANREVSSIIFREELEGLKNHFMDRFSLTHILSRAEAGSPLLRGRIDADKCVQLSRLHDFFLADAFFICGPEQMIYSVRDYLEGIGIDGSKIHFELFTTPESPVLQGVLSGQTQPGAGYELTVRCDGLSHHFRVEDRGKSLLDAALDSGLELPFSCKGGVCCTCKSRLLEGKVDMVHNYGLEPDEIREGFILTCQARPLTQKVVIDFDVKS